MTDRPKIDAAKKSLRDLAVEILARGELKGSQPEAVEFVEKVLADYMREVAAKTLEDAADKLELEVQDRDGHEYGTYYVSTSRLSARAEAIRKGE
jgi:hypothetical protein